MIHAHKSNYSKHRDKIEWIVVHYTANVHDTAKNNCIYFSGPNRNASAHYFVDELGYQQSVYDNETAWSVGVLHNRKYAKYWGKCTNFNSISIEMCNSCLKNEEVENQTIKLVKKLMVEYKIDKAHVVRHYDVCGKMCPITLIKQSEWNRFLSKLDVEDTELVKAVNKIIDSGIKLNANSWNDESKINLNNVPSLLYKLGGLENLIDRKVIEEPERWREGRYNANSVKWLLIKYAKEM